MKRPKPGWEFLCAHANEVPVVCPCPPTCGCRYYHCRQKDVVVDPMKEAAVQAKASLPHLLRASAPVLHFSVVGVAQPQGSSRAFVPKGWQRPVITSDNPKLKGWRDVVATAAGQAILACGWRLTDRPVAMQADFYLPRPKTRLKATTHVTRPDVDKLVRAVFDALTKVAWKDDSQVVSLHVTKAYAPVGQPPHVTISVAEST